MDLWVDLHMLHPLLTMYTITPQIYGMFGSRQVEELEYFWSTPMTSMMVCGGEWVGGWMTEWHGPGIIVEGIR